MSDIKDVHDHIVSAQRMNLQDSGNGVQGFIEISHVQPENLTNPRVTIELAIFDNPDYPSAKPGTAPQYVTRIGHHNTDGKPLEGTDSSVKVTAVLEAAIAFYLNTAKQLLVDEPDADGIMNGLAQRISALHREFLDVVDAAANNATWIDELITKHDGDMNAVREDMLLTLRAQAATAGVDPDDPGLALEKNIDLVLEGYLPKENQES